MSGLRGGMTPGAGPGAGPDGRKPVAPPVPKWALYAAGAAMALTVAAAAIGGATERQPVPAGAVVATRDIRFADVPGGAIDISDADTGAAIERLEPGDGNFIRALVRGLAQRRIFTVGQAASRDAPFRLTALEGGRLTLVDPATGRSVDLEAFGHTNEGAFAQILNLTAPEK